MSVIDWNGKHLGDEGVERELQQLEGNVKCGRLLLVRNSLSGIPHLTLHKQFTELKELRLWGNNIQTVTVANIPKTIETLDLGGNKIDNVPDLTVLKCLEVLYLYNNHITSINPSHIPLSVTVLDVDNNSVTELDDFSHHRNIHILTLQGNKLTHITPSHIPLSVTELDVGNNSVTEVGDFSQHGNLHTLWLHGNPVTVISGLPDCLQVLWIDSKVQVLRKNCFHKKNFAVLRKSLNTSELIQPPAEVFKRGLSAVLEYYEEEARISTLSTHDISNLAMVSTSQETPSTSSAVERAPPGAVGGTLPKYKNVEGNIVKGGTTKSGQDKQSEKTKIHSWDPEKMAASKLNQPSIIQPIDIDEIDLDRRDRLGKGSFGYVYKGTFRGTTVAIKEIQLKRQRMNNLEQIVNEVKICNAVRHPNIMHFMGYSLEEERRSVNILLILEYVDGETLDDVLFDGQLKEEFGVTERNKYCILSDVAKAIAYLHGYIPPIIHGDIKPPNIMITPHREVKVCDLGTSKFKSDSSMSLATTANVKGTPLYLAPEQLLASKTSSTKTDIYSLGVTMYEVIYEEQLLEIDDTDELIASIRTDRVLEILNSKQNDYCYDLISACLHFEPAMRPNAINIVEKLNSLIKQVAK